MRTILVMGMLLALGASAAQALKITDKKAGLVLDFKGRGNFSIGGEGLPKQMSVQDDPRVFVNGHYLGNFPGKNVILRFKKFDLLCMADTPRGNAHSVMLHVRGTTYVRWIKGLDKAKGQQTAETLKGFSANGIELYKRMISEGNVVKWDGKRKTFTGLKYIRNFDPKFGGLAGPGSRAVVVQPIVPCPRARSVASARRR